MGDKTVCIVHQDRLLRDDLAQQIARYGYATHCFSRPDDVVQSEQDPVPAALILNLDSNQDEIQTLLQRIKERNLDPRILFISFKAGLDEGLRAFRLGGSSCFSRPVNMDSLIGKLEEAFAQREEDPFRILVLEGNPELAGEINAILNDAGFLARAVFNPYVIMESLIEFNADLILMNLYQGDSLGMEVAAALRQQKKFQSIPIAFYSEEKRTGRIMAALRQGGEDYFNLPFKQDHADIISARAERYRLLSSSIIRDSLTGLFNHSRFRELIKREISLAKREDARFCLVKVDLDGFKNINDKYGHQAGDRVIKSLARLLRQRIWTGDILGRYSGAEFAVIVRSQSPLTAARVFNEIRTDYGLLRHKGESGEFHAGFSCGIAPFPRYRTDRDLIRAADKAREFAQSRGGNRIAVFEPTT